MTRSRSLLRLLPGLTSLAIAALGLAACTTIISGSGPTGGSTGVVTSSVATGAGGAATGASSSGATGTGAAGGATTGASSSSATGTGAAGGAPPECAGAVPVPAADGSDSGFAKCPDGTIRRDHPATCDPSFGVTACTGLEKIKTCDSDAQCVAHPHGRCAPDYRLDFSGIGVACDCVYPCAGDAECDVGLVCVCAGVVPDDHPWAHCASGTCASGHDCPSGECGISSLRTYALQCLSSIQLACRAPTDACRTDADCGSPADPQECVVLFPPAWQCIGQICMESGSGP